VSDGNAQWKNLGIKAFKWVGYSYGCVSVIAISLLIFVGFQKGFIPSLMQKMFYVIRNCPA